MNILFVGPVIYGSTTSQRYQSIKRLSKISKAINTSSKRNISIIQNIYFKFLCKIGFPNDPSNANQKIISTVKKTQPDILWLDKAITIKPETIMDIKKISKKIKIVGYSPDNMSRFTNRSLYFTRSLKFYDYFYTTKSHGVKELKKYGVKKVFFVNNSFDPHTHKKIFLNEKKNKFKASVGFVGTWEKNRAKILNFIAHSGINIKWWGSVSNRHYLLQKIYHDDNIKKFNTTLLGKDYTKAINSFDIAICFLRKDNKDLQTTRSVEIPACGTFMLAERTKEHQRLFKEGVEAEFFSSQEELFRKIRYYLKYKSKRRQIAIAGRKRCEKSGYSNDKMIKKILSFIQGKKLK